MEIQKTKKVWVVIGNKGNKKDRGRYPLYICATKATAKRLGRNGYINGDDCPIKESIAIMVDDVWYVNGRIKKPSKEDIKQQEMSKQYISHKVAGLKPSGIP